MTSERRIFITGAAGFIGFHLSKYLLDKGEEILVHGFDGITDYYDVSLKKARLAKLNTSPNFFFTKGRLEDKEALVRSVEDFNPSVIVHLAAQAGVRYSLHNPEEYIQSNVVGSLNLLEAARGGNIRHLLMASTSSIYGANQEMPFKENDKADSQLTIYAATKKANENMAHAYSHLWSIPTTMFRFFTVYGPWGRPDMALFKFVEAIIGGNEIDVYNFGNMYRDFTFVTDLVKAIHLLIDVIPAHPDSRKVNTEYDSLSPVAPWRVVNIGSSNKVRLLDFIGAAEVHLGMTAKQNLMAIQPGDVPATWADSSLLKRLTGFQPATTIEEGIAEFIDWFKVYYQK